MYQLPTVIVIVIGGLKSMVLTNYIVPTSTNACYQAVQLMYTIPSAVKLMYLQYQALQLMSLQYQAVQIMSLIQYQAVQIMCYGILYYLQYQAAQLICYAPTIPSCTAYVQWENNS